MLFEFDTVDEWAGGGVGDVSETSSDPSDSEEDVEEEEDTDEKDTDEKMLAEPVERWTDEDEKNLAMLKGLNSGAIAVDADRLDEMLEKKVRCDRRE